MIKTLVSDREVVGSNPRFEKRLPPVVLSRRAERSVYRPSDMREGGGERESERERETDTQTDKEFRI